MEGSGIPATSSDVVTSSQSKQKSASVDEQHSDVSLTAGVGYHSA